MRNDDIDGMFTSAVPRPRPGHWRGLDAESSRALTEISGDRGHAGHFDDHLGISSDQERGIANSDDPQRSCEKLSEDVATEILSQSNGTKESGVDFRTAAIHAVTRAVRTLAARSADPVQGARAIIAGVLRGAGENEDTALQTLSHAARAIIEEAVLLGYDPTAWIEGVFSGAVAGSKAFGLHRENAISAAAQGVLRGAEEAGLEPADAAGAAMARTIHALMAEHSDPARDQSPRRLEAR